MHVSSKIVFFFFFKLNNFVSMYISCILTFPSLLTICMFPLAFFKFDNKEQSVFKQSKLICMFKQSYVTICFSVAIVVVLFYKSGAAVYIGNLSVSAHRD